MELNRIPESEIDSRISRLQKALVDNGMDGALILENTDLLYFSGTMQQGQLYVPADGNAVLMIRRSFSRAQSESPLDNIVYFKSPGQTSSPSSIRPVGGGRSLSTICSVNRLVCAALGMHSFLGSTGGARNHGFQWSWWKL